MKYEKQNNTSHQKAGVQKWSLMDVVNVEIAICR